MSDDPVSTLLSGAFGNSGFSIGAQAQSQQALNNQQAAAMNQQQFMASWHLHANSRANSYSWSFTKDPVFITAQRSTGQKIYQVRIDDTNRLIRQLVDKIYFEEMNLNSDPSKVDIEAITFDVFRYLEIDSKDKLKISITPQEPIKPKRPWTSTDTMVVTWVTIVTIMAAAGMLL